jgi:ABC-type phosphate transport system substrate-binding protein
LSKQSIFARGAVSLSLAGAATLAITAAADANVVRPALFARPMSHAIVKGPHYVKVRRGPRVTSALEVIGGGATLPAIAYTGTSSQTANPNSPSPSDGSVFGAWEHEEPAYTISYCQVGSGNGKKVLNGTYGVSTPLGDYGSCPSTSSGFAKNKTGTNDAFDSGSDTDAADFAGSDAPFAQSEYSPLASSFPARGEFVQVPFVAGSVAIAYNNPDVPSTATLKLTVSEICKIADGEFTNWSSIPEAAAGIGTGSPVLPVSTTNPGLPSRAIKFVYRSDNSGTTFSFTNYLSAAVGTASPGTRTHCTGTGETWGLNQDFLSALPAIGTHTAFLGANGNTAVLQTINQNTGTIGYAEAANALADTVDTVGFADVFTVPVNNALYLKDPIKDLPAAANLIATFKKDETPVQTCGNTTNNTSNFNCTASGTIVGRPLPSDLTALTGDYKAGCIGVVDPSTYNSAVLGYPIVAVSNLEFYSSGNGIYTPALQALAETVEDFKNGLHGVTGITTIDKSSATGVGTTGFSTLNIADVFYSNSAIGIVPGCIN